MLAKLRRFTLGLLLTGSLAASGCVHQDTIPSPDELFVAANQAWVGRPFNDVMMRYGRPIGSVPFRDDITVYQFEASNTVRLNEPVTSYTSGRVGTYASNIPYAEKTTTTRGYNQTFDCMMRVGVRPDGTVHGVDFVGKMFACQVFMP